MSQSKLSFTYSEDDFRNARQQVARSSASPEVSRTIGKNGSLIERITVEDEDNEAIKEEIRKKIREEEGKIRQKEEREQRQKERSNKKQSKQYSSDYRRFNDKQYFQWSSEEELREIVRRKPKEHDHGLNKSSHTMAEAFSTSSSDCELCKLAEEAKRKKLIKKKQKRSESCQKIKDYRRNE